MTCSGFGPGERSENTAAWFLILRSQYIFYTWRKRKTIFWLVRLSLLPQQTHALFSTTGVWRNSSFLLRCVHLFVHDSIQKKASHGWRKRGLKKVMWVTWLRCAFRSQVGLTKNTLGVFGPYWLQETPKHPFKNTHFPSTKFTHTTNGLLMQACYTHSKHHVTFTMQCMRPCCYDFCSALYYLSSQV